jgi:DMSO/TMAO reductase YedYZ molybdopterin-dependent catalytic subunit
MSAAAPLTARSRVQRPVENEWPVVHLEAEIPRWSAFVVDGLVRHSRRLSLAELAAVGDAEHVADFHCVWGWSKQGVRWQGVPVSAVLSLVGVDAAPDTHVTIASASDTYSSCLPMADAARGMLAWSRDGAVLTPEAGGPLRFVSPADYWGYKDVKWASRLTVTDRFRAGFWESRVADPLGRIPDDVELP